ncbi:thioredoxin domain-containing 11 [Labeo rohita]|uniref:Thioredoxin domain-containing 11 n=1 Tax=Labeo rohita TaxID=84645 RepID=A0A498NIU1_LABRO|nr:thioredoxin domain-containing 11 [Labeo rohita]
MVVVAVGDAAAGSGAAPAGGGSDGEKTRTVLRRDTAHLRAHLTHNPHLQNVVAAPRSPVRFFPAEAPVVDLFLGQLEEADHLLEEADVSVVFYYAPWCAHCITARQHVQQVALRLAQQQAVVGYFQFNSSPQPAGYITFLLSALHALRRDHQGEVRFAVVTNQAVAEGVSLRDDESVYLHRRLNSSLVFPRTQRNFTAQAVCDWVFENRESVIRWIQPTRAKSYSLEAELQKGPALLTFLPHNPLTANQLLTQVTDVALHYHSCCGSEEDSSSVPSCCQSLPVASADVSICELCVSQCWALGLYQQQVRLSSASCRSVQTSYGPFGRFSVCCRSVPSPHRCPLLPDSITGLQCRTNKTLRFYLLDAQLNWPLAQRLGASGNQSSDLPFITIINLRDETHYVLKHNNTLGTHTKHTHTLTDSHTNIHTLQALAHGVPNVSDFIQNFSASYSPLHRHLVGHKQQQQTQSLIQEVTSDSFLHTVMDSQRDVLLLYYSAWCGFCSVLNHVFLQLARLFQGNGALTVARVNVGRNDLPWEFMVDHLPSVLFFPRHRSQTLHSLSHVGQTCVCFILNRYRFPQEADEREVSGKHAHDGSQPAAVHSAAHWPRPWEESGHGVEPKSLLEAELRALQREVFSLHQARERLSQQLAVLWRENRRLALHTHTLETQNAELQEQSGRLETLYREKTRQLTDTVHRLQELADASEELLRENTLLKVLLNALRDTDRWDADRRDKADGQKEADGLREKCEASL